MIFQKILLNDESYPKLKGKYVSYPKFMKDEEKYNKIKGDYLAGMMQSRNYENHKYLFRVMEVAIENDVITRMIKKEIITERYYSALWLRFKDETEIVLYLSKWHCLPLEEIINPDWSKHYEVASISYEKLDNIKFLEFREKAIEWWSDILEITPEDLKRMANN